MPPLSAHSWWELVRGSGPVLATAIHDGHAVREDLEARFALSGDGRLREEDPFTGYSIQDVPNRVIVNRSRFEIDLNRGTGDAVYRRPEQAWGLEVWKQPLDDAAVSKSLRLHENFYGVMGEVLRQMAEDHGRFAVLDVHSYNHRRDGADAPATPQDDAPDINIGTFSMPREKWAFIVDPLIEALGSFDFNGRRLDVRENVAFQGKGELTRFTHENFPDSGCAVAFEFKKFFMDEWSGEPDHAELETMRHLINRAVAVIEDCLKA